MSVAPRWLLLAHQLPAGSSNARVKTWRRLQQLGAIPTRNSVYVLPNTDQCREDFEWIRKEIVGLGGEATVFVADAVDRGAADDLVRLFHRAREADYRAITTDARAVRRAASRRREDAGRDQLTRGVRALRQRLTDVERVDYFGAPGRQQAIDAISAIQQATAPAPRREAAVGRRGTEDFRARRWVTRPRPGVDRMASAWLIRRFIDPAARFAFAERPGRGDIAFDHYEGEFTHQGARCTFEVLAESFDIVDPAVVRLGQIVHDLDLKDGRYGPPEAPAVDRMVDGLRRLHDDDDRLLMEGMAVFEALARSFGIGPAPAGKGPRRRASSARRRVRR